jgi:hypothetical protein
LATVNMDGDLMKTIDYLLKNSKLPGARADLGLLYSFAQKATAAEIDQCLSFACEDLFNSPEEFVVMCGIVGFCVYNGSQIATTIESIRKYASHKSWRIREAVAIGIQEIAATSMGETITELSKWITGNSFEKRAVVAALCEPKLLKNKEDLIKLFEILTQITLTFEGYNGKLSEAQTALRKALGYGWSVVIAALPSEGKVAFERLADRDSKHIRWILKENLKKNRLRVMDEDWVKKINNTLAK